MSFRITVLLCISLICLMGLVTGEMDIKLSENVKTEIDKYISDIVGKLTEKYENRISSLEQRIADIEANERVPIHDNHNGQTGSESYSKKGNDAYIHQGGEVVAEIPKDGPVEVEYNDEGQNAIDIQQDGEVDADGSDEFANTTRDGESTNTEHKKSLNKTNVRRIVQSALLSRDRRNVETHVAFFASLTNQVTNLGANQDIPFDNVMINLGNGYNNNHGTFIAPVSGLYVFGVTLHIYGERTWGYFVVNGNAIAKINIFPVQSSQMVIVRLDQGDDVSVQNYSPGKALMGDGYSTFCGFLLYQ
ncbi:Cerebellin-1 [Mactra antiquata]